MIKKNITERHWVMGNYCTQCKDVVTGRVGDFLYDEEYYKQTMTFKAASPIFDSLDDFYRWAAANKRILHHGEFQS